MRKSKKHPFWTWQKMLLVILGSVVVLTMAFNLYVFAPSRLRGLYESPHVSTDEDELIRVGFAQVGSESVWRTANTKSIQNTLTEENGFLLLFSNSRQKQENQIKTIRKFIAQDVDYIVLSPVSADGWDMVLSEAKTAGIPVIIVDRMVNVSDRSLFTAFVGSDMYNEGRKAGKWLEEYCDENHIENDNLNILVLSGTKGSTAETGRSAGFKEICRTHRNWRVLETVDGDFTTSKGAEVMSQMLEKYSDIDVLVSQNDDMTFGAISAMNDAGVTYGADGQVAIVSFDGTRRALIALRDGEINADVECNPFQGEYIADIINGLEAGEEIEKINYIDEKLFTKYNVNAYVGSRSY